MTDALRAALAADEDTPAGVDIAAVRGRARQLRRRRLAVAGAAVVTALAVAVPVAVLRPGGPAQVAAPAAATPTCPDRLPPPPGDGRSDPVRLPATR